MEWLPAAGAIVAALLGVGGIAAFIKAKPEAGLIVVNAAQGAVIVQSGVIDELRAELKRCQDEGRACREEVARLQKIMREAGLDA